MLNSVDQDNSPEEVFDLSLSVKFEEKPEWDLKTQDISLAVSSFRFGSSVLVFESDDINNTLDLSWNHLHIPLLDLCGGNRNESFALELCNSNGNQRRVCLAAINCSVNIIMELARTHVSLGLLTNAGERIGEITFSHAEVNWCPSLAGTPSKQTHPYSVTTKPSFSNEFSCSRNRTDSFQSAASTVTLDDLISEPEDTETSEADDLTAGSEGGEEETEVVCNHCYRRGDSLAVKFLNYETASESLLHRIIADLPAFIKDLQNSANHDNLQIITHTIKSLVKKQFLFIAWKKTHSLTAIHGRHRKRKILLTVNTEKEGEFRSYLKDLLEKMTEYREMLADQSDDY